MISYNNLAFVIVYCLLVFQNTVQGSRWQLSKEEDIELERQVQILNKPAVKTIRTGYGDTYDCVNFYSQPAFDHPFVQRKPISSFNQSKEHDINVELSFGLKDGGCPTGTVPIKRITKQDLVREKLVSKTRSLESNDSAIYNAAICRTKEGIWQYSKFKGAGGIISIHNPSVSGQQYSAARIKLVVGDEESIEAGWRVDPALYGDTQTRLYIRTQVGQSNCFNTRCPGFVITDTRIPLDSILSRISSPEGERYEVPINIIKDETEGNWILQIGPQNIQVGYWPKSIFSNPEKLPEYMDWGGETFNLPGVNEPPMGAGHKLIQATKYDAYIRKVEMVDERGLLGSPIVDLFTTDGKYYEVEVVRLVDFDYFKFLMFYGGPGKSPPLPVRSTIG